MKDFSGVGVERVAQGQPELAGTQRPMELLCERVERAIGALRTAGLGAFAERVEGECGWDAVLPALRAVNRERAHEVDPERQLHLEAARDALAAAVLALPDEVLDHGAASSAVQPHAACPCLHATPCDPHCTCVKPFSSRGCGRCCSYGSPEQQRAKAEHLAAVTAEHAAVRETNKALHRRAQRLEGIEARLARVHAGYERCIKSQATYCQNYRASVREFIRKADEALEAAGHRRGADGLASAINELAAERAAWRAIAEQRHPIVAAILARIERWLS